MNGPALGQVLYSYFEDHLKAQKGVRPSTVKSYRDGMRLFLQFVASDARRPISRLVLEDLTCQEARADAIYLEGVEAAPIRDVTIRRATIENAKAPFWIKRVENVRLEEVRINGRPAPATPPLTPEGEEKLKISS